MIKVRNVDLPILENHRARQVSAADANIGSGICRPDTFAMAPTRYSWVNSPPSASWIDTLGAPNSRAVVSAICCNGRATSPDALATARRISALACCCIRAALSCLFRLVVSDG